MSSDRIPLRPPPRALHYVTSSVALPMCGLKPRGSIHVTRDASMVTCPRCLAVLAAERSVCEQAISTP